MARTDLLTQKTKEVKDSVDKRRESMEKTISSLGSDMLDDMPGSDMPEDMLSTDFMGDEKEDPVLMILESEDPDLTLVVKEYWSDIQAEVTDQPVMKLYVAGLYKMANEYGRMEQQIVDMETSVNQLGDSPALTNERARLRDNMASMTTEGWKLLNALLDSLHKIQTMINKIKSSSGDDSDPFEDFLTGD